MTISRRHIIPLGITALVVVIGVWTWVDSSRQAEFLADAETACVAEVKDGLLPGYDPVLSSSLEEELPAGGLVFDVFSDDGDGQWHCSAEQTGNGVTVSVANGLWADVG